MIYIKVPLARLELTGYAEPVSMYLEVSWVAACKQVDKQTDNQLTYLSLSWTQASKTYYAGKASSLMRQDTSNTANQPEVRLFRNHKKSDFICKWNLQSNILFAGLAKGF